MGRQKHDSYAIRNLLRFLQYYKLIDKNTCNELLDRVPSFSRGDNGLAEDYVPLSLVLYSLAQSKSFTKKYTLFYQALYYSGGVRMEQLMEALQNSFIVKLRGKDYYRIRIKGLGTKTAAWAWLPKQILEEFIRDPPVISPSSLRAKFSKKRILTPTYIRSFCWQTAKQLLGHVHALLLQGRVGELKNYVTATSYDNLVYQLNEKYPVWMHFINDLTKHGSSIKEENYKIAKR